MPFTSPVSDISEEGTGEREGSGLGKKLKQAGKKAIKEAPKELFASFASKPRTRRESRRERRRAKPKQAILLMSPLMDFDLNPERQTSLTDIQGGILRPFNINMSLHKKGKKERHTSITDVSGGVLTDDPFDF